MNRRNRGGMIPRDNKNQNMIGNRIDFRFLIPSKAASIIIGKGGERIQRLRHECNARLSIPDNHGPERVFICESTMENCIRIWRDCAFDLKDCMFPMNADSRRAGQFRDNVENTDMDLRFLVHDSQVGAIIGKAGVNVKNLRMQYQLNVIKVYPKTAPCSSDRIVQMIGKFDKVFECFRVIYGTLEGQVIKGHVENYNSSNYDENAAPVYGGWGNHLGFDNSRKPNQMSGGAGGGGPMDRNQPPNGRFNSRPPNDQFFPKQDMNRNKPPMNRFDNFNEAPIVMDNEPFPPPYANRPPLMQSDQGFSGQRKRNNMVDNEQNNPKRGRLGAMVNSLFFDKQQPPNHFETRNDNRDNRIGGEGGPIPNRVESLMSLQPTNHLSVEKVEVSIPKTLVHAIKGAKGEVISNIINDSGADISICMDDEDSPDSILSLTGTKDQIEGAQYLLQICVKKSVLNL